jgi:hypothetical protein
MTIDPERPFKDWEIGEHTAKYQYGDMGEFCLWISNGKDRFKDWDGSTSNDNRLPLLEHLDKDKTDQLWDKMEEELRLRRLECLKSKGVMDEKVLATTIAEFMLEGGVLEEPMSFLQRLIYKFRYKRKK